MDGNYINMVLKCLFAWRTSRRSVYGTTPSCTFFVNSNIVCKLKKTIYGLKQAPKAWSVSFCNVLMTIGYVKSKYDNALLFKKVK